MLPLSVFNSLLWNRETPCVYLIYKHLNSYYWLILLCRKNNQNTNWKASDLYLKLIRKHPTHGIPKKFSCGLCHVCGVWLCLMVTDIGMGNVHQLWCKLLVVFDSKLIIVHSRINNTVELTASSCPARYSRIDNWKFKHC